MGKSGQVTREDRPTAAYPGRAAAKAPRAKPAAFSTGRSRARRRLSDRGRGDRTKSLKRALARQAHAIQTSAIDLFLRLEDSAERKTSTSDLSRVPLEIHRKINPT